LKIENLKKQYEKLGKIKHWNVPKEIEITH
jgi:hypothetical protein